MITSKKPIERSSWTGIKLETENSNLHIQNIQKEPDIAELKRKFTRFFKKTIIGTELDIQLKPDAKLIQKANQYGFTYSQPSVMKKTSLVTTDFTVWQKYRPHAKKRLSKHGKINTRRVYMVC